jgi:tetratricopeptide (TPR) repeat protein
LFRLPAARRAWELEKALGAEAEAAPRMMRALADVPAGQWDASLLMDVARALRRAGLTGEARALLAAGERSLSKRDLELEQALADLRDGPPEHALPRLLATATSSSEGAYRYAEALFFAGLGDSALVWYKKVAADPASEFTGPSFERIYLIEDADPREALPAFGRVAWEEWRGERKRATALTESLVVTLPRGPLWAQAAIMLATQRAAAGDARAALEPLLALADSLPGDRLAPLARQRAGDLYLDQLKDAPRALAQYEECLTRYPRAWNAAAVRRKLELLRRDGRL